VTYHSTCKDRPGRFLCPDCLHWDPRPEEGLGPRVGYCTARDTITKIRCECEHYEQATAPKVEARNRRLYGQIPDEFEGEE
jgi:hypothetical protein